MNNKTSFTLVFFRTINNTIDEITIHNIRHRYNISNILSRHGNIIHNMIDVLRSHGPAIFISGDILLYRPIVIINDNIHLAMVNQYVANNPFIIIAFPRNLHILETFTDTTIDIIQNYAINISAHVIMTAQPEAKEMIADFQSRNRLDEIQKTDIDIANYIYYPGMSFLRTDRSTYISPGIDVYETLPPFRSQYQLDSHIYGSLVRTNYGGVTIPTILHLIEPTMELVDTWKSIIRAPWEIRIWDNIMIHDIINNNRRIQRLMPMLNTDGTLYQTVLFLGILELHGGVVISSNFMPIRRIPNVLTLYPYVIGYRVNGESILDGFMASLPGKQLSPGLFDALYSLINERHFDIQHIAALTDVMFLPDYYFGPVDYQLSEPYNSMYFIEPIAIQQHSVTDRTMTQQPRRHNIATRNSIIARLNTDPLQNYFTG